MATLSGDADLEVRGPRAGFDENALRDARARSGHRRREPGRRSRRADQGRDDALRIFGVDAFRAGAVTPALVGDAADPLDVLRPDTAVPEPAAAAWLDAPTGDTLTLQSGLRDVTLTVAGPVRSPIGAALRGHGHRRRAGAVRARRTPHAHRPARAARRRRRDGARAASWPRCPPGVGDRSAAGAHATRRRACRARTASTSTCWRWSRCSPAACWCSRRRRCRWSGGARNSRCCARWALRAGAWSRCWSSKARSSARRARCSACSPGMRSPWRRCACSAATSAPASSAASRRPSPSTRSPPLIFGALGIAVGDAGQLSRRRSRPRARRRRRRSRPATSRRRFVRCGARGPASRCWPRARWPRCCRRWRDLPLFGYLAIALLLFGTLLLMPRIGDAAARARARRRARFPRRSRSTSCAARPGQASVSLATIVASVSLMVSMAIMVASFRHSLDDWLDASCPPTCTCARAPPATARISAPTTSAVRGAARRAPRRVPARAKRRSSIRRSRASSLLARDLPADDPARALPLVGRRAARAARRSRRRYGSAKRSRISMATAPGARSRCRSPGAPSPFTVAGVWRDYARQQGAVVIERARYAALTGDTTANDAALVLDAGARVDDVRREIEARLGGDGRLDVRHAGRHPRAVAAHLRPHVRRDLCAEAAAVGIGLVGLVVRRSARWCSRGGASSACCGTSA